MALTQRKRYGYKIVRVVRGQLKSYATFSLGKYSITYKPNKWVRARPERRGRYLSLFYFAKRADALTWFKISRAVEEEVQVWTCEVRDAVPSRGLNKQNLWPKGTHRAKAIRLIRRLEWVKQRGKDTK